MTVIDVPALDLAPTVPSRIVYGTVLIPTEDRGPQGAWIEVAIPGEIKLPGEHTTITGRSARFPVHPDGSFEIRLPTIAAGIEPDDWALSIRLSWRKFEFPMRVPVGTDRIWIEDCIFPELVPGEDPAKYFLAGVQIRSVKTVGPDQPAKVRSDVTGGVLSMDWEIPRGAQGLPGATAIEGDEAVAAYISTTGTSATRDALMNTLTTTGTRPVGKGEIVLNARDMGALGDGVTDDSAALQAAVDAAEGGTLLIPAGTYNMTEPMTVKSGTTIYGEPGTELYVGSFAFQIQGEAGPEVAFGAHAGSGDRSVTTAVPHGLAVGDTVRIISQRDALSSDAGENWRLGYATPGAAVCYFSEFHQVMTVDSDTKVTFRTPILFPSYRADDAQEQHPGGRTTSIIQKIDTAKHITIRDLSVNTNYGTCFETRYAEDVLIESVRTYNRSRTGGAVVFFRDSLNCRAVNVRARYSTEELLPADGHQRRNTFKTTGTQNCGFDSCFVQNSSQCIDFTYDAGGTPSVFSYVTNCEVIGSQDNCATAHGGTYGAQFTNNRFIECRMNGILNRSRSAVITGNTVIGRHFDDPNSQLVSYGVALYEGWARDCTVTGNQVHGFKSGITIWDAQDPGEWFEWVGAVITGNVVTGCRHGIFLHRSANNLSMDETGILIADNIIRASDTYGTNGSGIWVGPHYIGVVIQSNIINGMNNAADGIMVRPDAHYTRIAENRIVNFTAAGIRALGPTDPQIPVARLMPANNYYANVGSGSSAHQVIGSGVELWSGANTKPGYVRVSRPTTLEDVIARLATLGMWA